MQTPTNGYSARVRLRLVVGRDCYEVGQVSPSSCLLVEPIEHPPCDAEMVIEIDGKSHSRRVVLRDGISQSSKRVIFS